VLSKQWIVAGLCEFIVSYSDTNIDVRYKYERNIYHRSFYYLEMLYRL
jgi:hypothetical protein